MHLGWKTRAGLVVSGVWLCLVFMLADENHQVGQLLGVGLLPLVVIWGVVWAVAGWRAQRPEKPATTEVVQQEAKAKRNLRIRTFVAVIAVLGIGLFAATWQFKAADNEAGGHMIPRWFGEFFVYGLIAYAILRAVPKIPPGFPAVLAALVVVGSVNYKAFSAIAEDRQALDSLAKATPLVNKMQSGIAVSDQEVRDAHVGLLEPLMLAEATFGRDVISVNAAYQKVIGSMQPELMLSPSALASANSRFQSRAKLRLWEQATNEFKAQMDAAITRGKLGVQAAQSQMPPAMTGSMSSGFDDSAAQLTAYLTSLVITEREGTAAILGLLDLMDANQGSYVVDKGPPANLMFSDEATLGRYRELMGSMIAASQRQQEAKVRLTQTQSEKTAKLGSLFKP